MGALFNPETVWVLIPLAAIIGSFIVKAQRIKTGSGRDAAEAEKLFAEMRETIRRLEARVANLERAVTTAESERKYS